MNSELNVKMSVTLHSNYFITLSGLVGSFREKLSEIEGKLTDRTNCKTSSSSRTRKRKLNIMYDYNCTDELREERGEVFLVIINCDVVALKQRYSIEKARHAYALSLDYH